MRRNTLMVILALLLMTTLAWSEGRYNHPRYDPSRPCVCPDEPIPGYDPNPPGNEEKEDD